jgi:hypothetical protein
MKIFIFLLFLFSSCGNIHYRSDGRIPISFYENPDHKLYFEVKTVKESYLFGIVPEKHPFYIDSFLLQKGIATASRLKIEEYQTIIDNLITMISLGFYSRRTVMISGTTQHARY